MGLLGMLGLAGALVVPAGAQGGSEVVARVGAATISRPALDAQLLTYYGKNGLQQLVERSMLDQEAARLKVTLADAELNERLAEQKKAAGANFNKALEAEGISEATWRERVRTGLLTEKLTDKVWPIKPTDLVRLSVRYARVHTRNQALEIIRNVQAGQDFELLILQRSLDKDTLGFVQPNPFLRVEKPYMFRMVSGLISQGKLRVGQMCREPVQSDEFYLAVRLEKYLDASTLKPREREVAEAKIRSRRIAGLVNKIRQRHKAEHVVSLDTLAADPKLPGDTVLTRVSPTAADKGAKADEITRKELFGYLYANFAKTALEQLIERSIVQQQARTRNVVVSDAEMGERLAETRKALGEAGFKTTLDREGISETAFRERSRYVFLAQKTAEAQAPLRPEDLQRYAVRYVRVASRDQAEKVLQAAQAGTQFEQLVRQVSLDKNDGLIQPRAFLPVDHPEVARAVAGLKNGQVASQPLKVGDSFLVLKLEARFGPETMSAKERESAVRKINTLRLGQFLDAWRKATRVEYVMPLDRLVAGAG